MAVKPARLSLLGLLLLSCSLSAQQLQLPRNTDYLPELEKQLLSKSATHKGFGSVTYDDLGLEYDTAAQSEGKWLIRKLFEESFFRIDSGDFKLRIDPLLNLEFGRDGRDTVSRNLYTNTRGVLIRGEIGDHLSFESSFLENQSFFGSFLSKYVSDFQVVPGSGRVKPFKNDGFDYAMASGYINLKATDWLRLSVGHGKHFIGMGYRSLLLSDNAFNYPYLKAELRLWGDKIRYQYMSAQLRRLERLPATLSTEPQFRKKLMSTNYLSFKPNEIFEISLFEGLTWQRWDSVSLDLNYAAFVPIIGVNSLVQSNNQYVAGIYGINLLVNPMDGLRIYGQAMNSLRNGHTGAQIGLKTASLGIENLNARVEYNWMEMSNYFGSGIEGFYSHYNQSLAHPRGVGFSEVVVRLQYSWKRLYFLQHLSMYFEAEDSQFVNHESNYPPDPLALYYFPSRNIVFQNYEVSYLINPAYALNAAIGIRLRSDPDMGPLNEMSWFYAALRTSLNRVYFDF
jgi:hypothetical protein